MVEQSHQVAWIPFEKDKAWIVRACIAQGGFGDKQMKQALKAAWELWINRAEISRHGPLTIPPWPLQPFKPIGCRDNRPRRVHPRVIPEEGVCYGFQATHTVLKAVTEADVKLTTCSRESQKGASSPSWPELRRCSPRSHPNTLSLRIPLCFSFCLVGLDFMNERRNVISFPCFLDTEG